MKDYSVMAMECYAYNPPMTRQPDFDAFWAENLAALRARPLNLTMKRVNKTAERTDEYDFYYDGSDGSRIHGIALKPKGSIGCPIVLHYHGFGGSCGEHHWYYDMAKLGYAVFAIDMRGQGGSSENRFAYGYRGTHLMSMGAPDHHQYYVKWQILDCIRLADIACGADFTDSSVLVAHGSSQGGAASVTVSALDSRVTHCICDVPSNTDIVRRIEGRHGSFAALADYLETFPQRREEVYRMVSYFDTMNLAGRITAHVYASCALNDDVCPGKLFFACFNKIQSPKAIEIYYESGHEGGGDYHHARKLGYLKRVAANRAEPAAAAATL